MPGGCHQLLPSFLHLIRALKTEGRSFSLSFRTFGGDSAGVIKEYNSLCEGRHPLFAGSSDKIVLDGSDGQRDMRIHIVGTWVRTGENADELLLALGTHEQPPNDATTAAQRAAQSSTPARRPGAGAAVGLRDYYPAWEAKDCTAAGGKPLFLERDNPEVLQIIFDDHILPNDAHIVDARRAEQPMAPPLPIAATFNTHLIRAEPFKSILDRGYFPDAVTRAEERWRQSAARRAKLCQALGNYEKLVAQLGERDAPGEHTAYVPHAQSTTVLLASDAHTFEHDEEGGH